MDDPVWLHVSFDLPTVTAAQRRNANRFRHFLLKDGFARAQLSVYIRYLRRRSDADSEIARLTARAPDGGDLVVLVLTDQQWGGAVRFSSGDGGSDGQTPGQLEIF